MESQEATIQHDGKHPKHIHNILGFSVILSDSQLLRQLLRQLCRDVGRVIRTSRVFWSEALPPSRLSFPEPPAEGEAELRVAGWGSRWGGAGNSGRATDGHTQSLKLGLAVHQGKIHMGNGWHGSLED